MKVIFMKLALFHSSVNLESVVQRMVNLKLKEKFPSSLFSSLVYNLV